MSGQGASRRFALLSTGSFVGLGLPDGMIGTAWPTLHASLGVPVGDLGLVLLATTAGSLAVLSVTGRVRHAIGIGPLCALAAVLSLLGAIGVVVAPGLWILLAASVPLGAGSGLVDGGLNTEVALSGGKHMLNLLHGFYGVGTSIGPLLVTGALLAAGSWRPGYGLLSAIEVLLAAAWWRGRREGAPPGAASVPTPDAADRHGALEPARGGARAAGGRRAHAAWPGMLTLGGGMVVFFLYTGLEVAAGQWEATFCRSELGFSAGGAGLAVFGYWGALTAVRLALGVAPGHVAPSKIVTFGLAGALLGSGLIWWRPGAAGAIAGFVLVGASLAGVFPALVMLTPQRLGAARAERAIAWQVGAAGVGGSACSALIGVAVGTAGVGVLGSALVALAAALVAAHAGLARLSHPLRSEPAGPA